jgi:type II secretory pathway component PulF
MAVGEANGRRPEMLRYGSEWLERSRRIRNRLAQALAYPAVVTLLACAVGYFLVTRVIPKILAFVTKNTGAATLPPATEVLVRVTNLARAYGAYVIVGAAAAFLILILAKRTRHLGPVIDFAQLRLPLVGPVFVASANAIWCRTLGLLLASGVHVVQSMELVAENTLNRHYRAQVSKAREEILLGVSITDALEATALPRLCPMAAMMLGAGEGAGTADASLLKAAEYAEEDLVQRIELLSKLIEPAIYIVVGVMVGFVYYAFFMATQAVTQSVLH